MADDESGAAGLRVSRPWLALVVVAVLASVVEVHLGHPGWSVDVHLTPVTIAAVALAWLPAVVQAVLARGGKLTAAGVTLELERLRELGTASSAARPATDVLADIEGAFADVRDRPSGWERTAESEAVLAQARFAARQSADVLPGRLAVFRSDTEAGRAVTLGLLQGSLEPLPGGAADALVDAMTHPRSTFEQYHGLRTARDRFAELSPEGRRRVRRAAQALLDDGLPTGDRRSLARQVVALAD